MNESKKQQNEIFNQDKSNDNTANYKSKCVNVKLVNGEIEKAELQECTNKLKLRRDMNEEEKVKFDKRFEEEFGKEKKKEYYLKDSQISYIKYRLKNILNHFSLLMILNDLKNGKIKTLPEDPKILEFIENFQKKKQYDFILCIPSVQTSLSKQEYLKNLKIDDLVTKIKYKPLTEIREQNQPIDIILHFDHLDKFKFAMDILMNNDIQFNQFSFTEKAITIFGDIFIQNYLMPDRPKQKQQQQN